MKIFRFVVKGLMLAVALGVMPGLAAAEDAPRKPESLRKIQTRPAQKAPAAAPRSASNPCAIYGAGFVRIEGTETCVRMGGSVGAGVGGASVR